MRGQVVQEYAFILAVLSVVALVGFQMLAKATSPILEDQQTRITQSQIHQEGTPGPIPTGTIYGFPTPSPT